MVDSLDAPVLSAEDQQHLAKVLRVRAGETVVLIDGNGAWRTATWASDGEVDPVGDVTQERSADPAVTVGFSLLKGDRSEWVVQKLTELGVDRIVPLTTERTIVRWDDAKAAKNVERFRRVAYEAAMQSRRVFLPEVTDVADVSSTLAQGAAMAAPGGSSPSLSAPFVIVGPEGGWSTEELQKTAKYVDLGPTILRAETAAVAAGTLLCALRHGNFTESVDVGAR